MGESAAIQRMTAAEYLEWERAQRDKHELHLGEVFPIAGGSVRHNYLANAMGAELRNALRGGLCRVLSSDQRISAGRGERYVYADAAAVCGELEIESGTRDVLANRRSSSRCSRRAPRSTTAARSGRRISASRP
jgi:hypothetical protein